MVQAVAVAERVRDKNRNIMLQFRSMEKKGCSSAKLLLFSSYDSFSFLYFHCGENEKIISFSYLDTENLMFFLLHSLMFFCDTFRDFLKQILNLMHFIFKIP